MDAETVKRIAELGKEAAGPVVLQVPGLPAGKIWVRNKDGEYDDYYIDDPHRQHVAQDLPSIVRLAADAIARAKAEPVQPDFVEFFHCRFGVVLVYPDTRRNTASIKLTKSPQFLQLCLWESSRSGVTQADLIRALRVTFKGLVSEDLQGLIRRISVTVNSKSDVQRTGSSLGKDIEAKLGDNAKLPEYLTFTVPVFAEGAFAGVRAAVECAFDFDGGTNLFTLTPVAGSLETAMSGAEVTLRDMLTQEIERQGIGANSGVYFGQP